MVTDQFQARDDKGNVYQIVVHQEKIATEDLDSDEFTLGEKEYQLADGRALNQLSDRTFEIIETSTEITRD